MTTQESPADYLKNWAGGDLNSRSATLMNWIHPEKGKMINISHRDRLGKGSGWWEGNSEPPFNCAAPSCRDAWATYWCMCFQSSVCAHDTFFWNLMYDDISMTPAGNWTHALAFVGTPYWWVPRSSKHAPSPAPKLSPWSRLGMNLWSDPYKMLQGGRGVPFPAAPVCVLTLLVLLVRILKIKLSHWRHWWWAMCTGGEAGVIKRCDWKPVMNSFVHFKVI